MSLSRRATLLGTGAALACRGAPPSELPSSWVEVRFGRHAIDVPPELLARHKTEFALEVGYGLATSDLPLLEQQWQVLMSEAEENVKRYAGPDDNQTRLDSAIARQVTA